MSTENLEQDVNNLLDILHNKLTKNRSEVYSILIDHFGEDRVDLQVSKEEEIDYILYTDVPTLLGCANIQIDENFCYSGSLKDLELKDQKHILNIILGPTNFNSYFMDSWAIVLIHYPETKVTNEYGDSTTIYDSYIKFNINRFGRLQDSFKMARTTYTREQFDSNYMHSHANGIHMSDDGIGFSHCCLGTGPIATTVNNLNTNFDSDIWRLFCVELDRYIETESISGGPYNRISYIGNNASYSELFPAFVFRTTLSHYNINPVLRRENSLQIKEDIKHFIKYVIESKKIKFRYVQCAYDIGMSFKDLVLTMSNLYIDWINKNNGVLFNVSKDDLINKRVLIKGIIKNNKFYKANDNRISQITSTGKSGLIFKGKEVPFKIIGDIEESNAILILNTTFIMKIVSILLNILNYRYEKSESTPSEEIWYV